MAASRHSPGEESGGAHGRVTVVMLTYNRKTEVLRGLARLQALPERPPIIVVDNGGSDGTAASISAEFPNVQLVSAATNLGAAGRNLGVERVNTPYVAFCDDDTWWAPGALHHAADILDGHPSIAILNASIVVGPDARADPACVQMAYSPLETVAGVGPMLTGFMAGAVVMRTAAYRNAGGYWRPFFIGGEESLLAMDILDAGGQIVYAPALQVHHWPSTLRDSALRRRLLARNAIWSAWLRLPGSTATQRSLHTLRALPHWRERWLAVADALAGMPAILRHRRVLKRSTLELLERVWDDDAALLKASNNAPT